MFRSQSGPGGLSINTASANALSSSQPNGAPPTATAPSKPIFGTSGVSSQSQATSSLFGNPPSQPTNTQQAGSLFGNQGATSQNTNPGMFGSQQTQPRSNNLFGLAPTQQAQAAPGSSLFGSTPGQNNGQQAGNSLFGNVGTAQGKSSIFGGSQNIVPTQQPNSQPPPPSLFSSSIGQYSQQQQTVPGVRVTVNELRSTTRFSDLHEDLQKVIEYVDGFISNKIQWQEACQAGNETAETMTQQISPDVELCSKQLETLQNALENDAESISGAKHLVRHDAADTKLSIKAIQTLKLPQHVQQGSWWNSTSAAQAPVYEVVDTEFEEGASRSLVDYFSKQSEAMSQTLESCKQNLTEIESYLGGLESQIIEQIRQRAMASTEEQERVSAEDQVRELALVLRSFEDGILGVAAKVGAARETVQDVMLGKGVTARPNSQARPYTLIS